MVRVSDYDTWGEEYNTTTYSTEVMWRRLEQSCIDSLCEVVSLDRGVVEPIVKEALAQAVKLDRRGIEALAAKIAIELYDKDIGKEHKDQVDLMKGLLGRQKVVSAPGK